MWYSHQKLRNYGERYYCRYFPSSKKFLEKLTEKSGEKEWAKKVFSELSFLINEEKLIESKIRFLLARHKNKRDILTNLIKKWFEKTDIQSILENIFDSSSASLLNHRSTQLKIENLLKKWKSKKYIFQKLVESPQDREMLEEIFQEMGTQSSDALHIAHEKYAKKYSWPKLTQKLVSQGFSYGEVKQYLSEQE